MNAILDAGALVAIDKRDRRVEAMLRVLQQRRIPLWTSAAVVAQVWRRGDKQALLAKVLAGVRVHALDERYDRRIGELLARTRTADVIDAHVAMLVTEGDQLLTSDPDDLRRLVSARRVEASIVEV
jgi:hypothetical protein